jgi:two-component system cell cycle sensor histidine kinase/response regulator CckA
MRLGIATAGDASGEVAALIETLHETSRRLEELTAGEVDSVMSRDGRTFLLRDAQDYFRDSEAAKQAALLSEMQAIFDLVPATIWIKDTENRFLRVNKQAADASGMSVHEIEGKTANEIFPDEALKYYSDDLEVIHSAVPKLGIVEVLRDSHGNKHWVQTDKVPIFDKAGKVTGIVAMARDITEYKLSEEALRAREAEFRLLAEAMPQIVWVTRGDGWNIYFNQQWTDYTGLTREESAGYGWNRPFHPDDRNRAWEAWQQATATAGTYSIESRLRRSDGVYRWWLVRGVPLKDAAGNIVKWFGTCTDVHDMKVAELEISRTNLALQESERRFSDVLKNVDLISVMLDCEARIIFCNDYFLGVSGWMREEVIGRNWFDLFIPPEAGDLKTKFFEFLAGSRSASHHENAVLTRSGEQRRIRWNNTVLRSAMGEVTGTASIGDDITERLEMEKHLRVSEERFRSIFSAISEGVFLVDAETGAFLEANEPGATMHGYRPDEIIGRDSQLISSNVPPYTQSDALLWLEKAASTGETQTFDWHARAKDGRLFWTEVSIRFAEISGRRVILSIVRDVSEQRRLAAELRQAQKMEAIGTLAGGVAHELNNLLHPILMITDIVLAELPEKDPHCEDLRRVIDAGSKAAEIVQRILAFGRADEASHDALNMSAVVREAIGFIRTVLPSSITLRTQISDHLGTVCGDKTQITQVLINLATNARDAIAPKTGKVSISLSRLEASEARPLTLIGTVQAGAYAVLTVEDSGSGINEDIRARIFEPFFTTKGVGKGTGLGLSIMHGIVTGHGGAIQVASTLGTGTKFSIYLPIARNEAEPDLAANPKIARIV